MVAEWRWDLFLQRPYVFADGRKTKVGKVRSRVARQKRSMSAVALQFIIQISAVQDAEINPIPNALVWPNVLQHLTHICTRTRD